MNIRNRLAELGLILPQVTAPVANYIPHTFGGEILVVSGQIGAPGAAAAGPVGVAISVEAARVEARVAALKLLSVVDAAVNGDASRIRQVLRLGVFIAASVDFEKHGEVADGASDLLIAVFGDAGRHARTAIGVTSLPRKAAVEIDSLIWVRA